MAKASCILYSEMDVSDDPVNCVYFIGGECRAQPVLGKEEGYYKPNEEDKTNFCSNSRMMRTCPRAGLYHEHLRAIGLEKKAT
jgi:hypothetical protein